MSTETIKSFYPNNQLNCVYSLNKKNKIHGLYTRYHENENGNVMELINYEDDKKHGDIKTFYHNGKKNLVGKLVDDKES